LFFVKALSSQEADKAVAGAFSDAQRQAQRLAASAGKRLGELKSLGDAVTAAVPTDMTSQQEAAMEAMFGGHNKVKFGDEADRPSTELLGQELRPLRHEVKVQATFVIDQ